jgi:hypothetical protein
VPPTFETPDAGDFSPPGFFGRGLDEQAGCLE